MRLTKLFKDFFESEKAGGFILVGCTAVSLLLANSATGNDYINFWETYIGGHSLVHWINDGLMAIFFLLIGLELEREIYVGELSNIKNATLPLAAAIGGMLVPAGIYWGINYGTPTQSGIGIPMATDIAFALGVLSLLGNRIPASLKVFLTALAVIDDLGAILIIAFFYSKGLVITNLLISLGIFGVLLVLNRLKIHNLIPYMIGGVAMWYFMLHSGVHATITGVLLAFALPFGDGSEKSPSYLLQHWLHKPVAFVILPIFALANTAFVISANFESLFQAPYSLGILLGLCVGKPLGIAALSALAVALGWGKLPDELSWPKIIGAGMLAGIGFTMSIFITLLAFDDTLLVNNAKFTILIASLLSAIVGYIVLTTAPKLLEREQD
ncbi:MAG: Na+/H+ antiporter NhaA [Runella sp.]